MKALFDICVYYAYCLECPNLKQDHRYKNNKLIYTCRGVNINKIEECDNEV